MKPLVGELCSLSYRTRYGYSWADAIRAEFWWRIEHVGFYRGGEGGLFGYVRRFGYGKRKAAERKAGWMKSQPWTSSSECRHAWEPIIANEDGQLWRCSLCRRHVFLSLRATP